MRPSMHPPLNLTEMIIGNSGSCPSLNTPVSLDTIETMLCFEDNSPRQGTAGCPTRMTVLVYKDSFPVVPLS